MFRRACEAHAGPMWVNVDENLPGMGLCVWVSMRMWHFREERGRHFELSPSDSNTSQTTYDRAHFLIADERLVWKCDGAPRFVVCPVRVASGSWRGGKSVATLVSANFQIDANVSAYWFEWIASSSALPRSSDNRRSTRTGDIAGQVVDRVRSKWAFVFIVARLWPFGCRASGS